MEKFNKILKNVVIFLAIFLILNYVLRSCQSEKPVDTSSPLTFITTETEYSRTDTVTVEIRNNTKQNLTIKNECPAEPFDVYRFQNNKWEQIFANPEIECKDAKDFTVEPTKDLKINYENWNHSLFSQMGRYKIEYKAKVNDKEETFVTNEFQVVEEGLFSKLWNGVFYRPIYNGLIGLIKIMPWNDLGLATILLTIIIRTILLVPSRKALESQKRMQEIQPRLNKIKEKYKGDQQRISMETMALWKEAKVNPFGSCLPILLQFPFLVALFFAIKAGLNPDNAYLLYSNSLAIDYHAINTNFLGILDLTKPNLYVLPLIIGGLQFLQMKLSFAKKAPKEGEKNEMAMANNMMTYMMPVMIAVFTASVPAGVGLYWGTSTIYGIIQQLFVNKKKLDKNEPEVRVITKND